jgi:hypothetical protein
VFMGERLSTDYIAVDLCELLSGGSGLSRIGGVALRELPLKPRTFENLRGPLSCLFDRRFFRHRVSTPEAPEG